MRYPYHIATCQFPKFGVSRSTIENDLQGLTETVKPRTKNIRHVQRGRHAFVFWHGRAAAK
jgi:hypothetical protein